MTLPLSRRDLLLQAGGGCGALALSWLLAREGQATSTTSPIRWPRNRAHFQPTANAVIFMFMVGGPSPIDLFDPKPDLLKHQGQPLPPSFGKPVSQFTKGDTPLLASTRTFKKHGQSGLDVSDLMPHLATCVDDIAFLRSCWCTSIVHAPAMYELHSGRTLDGLSQSRLVGDLRPRQRQRQPAGVLRPAATGRDAGGRRAVLERRLPADRLPGHAAAPAGRVPSST